jgi:NAD(P)-dependent dehydrogenase (short-subunit alcohol dehydrogenase family)
VESNTIYAAVKAATISLTYGMARELLGTGVTVNCVNNAGRSRLWEAARAHFERSLADGLIASSMWEEYLSIPPPEYAAAVTAFLVSEEAGGITGELIGCGNRVSAFWHPHEVDRFQHDPASGPLPFETVADILPAMISMAEHLAPSYVLRVHS